MNIKDLYERMREAVTRMREIQDRAEADNRDLNAEESVAFDEANADVTRYENQIQREQRLAELESQRVDDEVRREGLENLPQTRGRNLGHKEPQRAAQPSHDLALRAWYRHKQNKALTTEEQDACRRLGLDPRSDFFDINLFTNAQHRQYIESRMPTGTDIPLSTVKDGTGGETIPFGFSYRLEQEMWWYGGMMQAAEVWRTDSGNSVFWPVVSDFATGAAGGCSNTPNIGKMMTGGGGTGGENLEVTTETTATYSEVEFKAFKATSDIVRISQELLEDSAFNIGEITAAQLGERLGRIINNKATLGVGTTEPTGIMTGACDGVGGTGTPSEGTNAIHADDLINLAHSVDPAYRGAGRYMFHDQTLASIRKLTTVDGWYIWQPSPLQGLQQGVAGTIYGYPYIVNNDMDVLATSGGTSHKVAIFGDLSRFKLRLVRQMRLRVFVEKWGTFDQTGYLAFVRFDSNHIMPPAYKTMTIVAPA